MAERKRLPAYGAKLRDLTRSGVLPLCVHVLYGFDWKARPQCCWDVAIEGPHPLLAIRPPEFVPGTLDFSVVTGLKVCVFDRDGRSGDFLERNVERFTTEAKAVYSLLGELAAYAAEVEVYSPLSAVARWSAHELAARQARPEWPFWWSAELEVINAKRRNTWQRAFDHATRQRRAA